MTDDVAKLAGEARGSIPKLPPDVIEWARENVVLPSSSRSTFFDPSISPWIVEPIRMAIDPYVRCVDLMKPVQTGGSVAGEIVLLYQLMFGRGFVQYNWSNDKRAEERWFSRVKPILDACPPVAKRMENLAIRTGEIDFGNVFFRMQGAFVSSNLDSDTIPTQINEEIHDWQPGHLNKAQGRQTAVWNRKAFDISNAGNKDDQWDVQYRGGTMQPWAVLCPGCGKFHVMRTYWDERRQDLGGLRYDADGCRIGRFDYNYAKLRPTIRYQFPCGKTVHNQDVSARRKLSLSGKYLEPTNPGAELSRRSYTYEAVSVDYIDWMDLIQDKHVALRARSLGDPKPWIEYKQKRECIPYDPDDVPIVNVTKVVAGLKKSREGLPDPKLRLGGLDRQQGETAKGEFPHWWLVIRDFKVEDGGLRSLLVYEGKLETDEQVVAVLKEHGVNPWQVVADSGDDTTHVYLFCLRHGINAIKGGREEYYVHEKGARRIFSPERPLHAMINREPIYPYVEVDLGGGKTAWMPDPREPLFWLYSKPQIRERLHWLRNSTKFETPEDVSDDYRAHMDAEERVKKQNPADGSFRFEWVQKKSRNDLFVDECYIAMQVDQAGLILIPGETEQQQKGKTK